MDKILAYLTAVGAALNTAADALDAMAVSLPGDAHEVVAKATAELRAAAAADADVVAFIQHPDSAKLWDYIKHHGNLPGTPESREAKS